jgi:hypothetical protein
VDFQLLGQTSPFSRSFDWGSRVEALALDHLEGLLVEVPFEGEAGVPCRGEGGWDPDGTVVERQSGVEGPLVVARRVYSELLGPEQRMAWVRSEE